MSGGAWGYQSGKIEERGKEQLDLHRLVAGIETELDWGVSCDTCGECAERRVIAALKEFFESECRFTDEVKTTLHRKSLNLCPECAARQPK